MKVRITTEGQRTFQQKLEKYSIDVLKKAEHATTDFVENVRDEYKARSRFRTGDNRRHTKSEARTTQTGIIASVYNNSDHVVFLEKGHMVRKGQLFFDKRSKSFKRIKQTRFIKGDHHFSNSLKAHTKDFYSDLNRAVKW
ncbi:HK97 gp10 family phage protein [Listeria monocytogenes]